MIMKGCAENMAKIMVEVDVNLREFADSLIREYRLAKKPVLRMYFRDKVDMSIIKNNTEGIRRYLRAAGIGSVIAKNNAGYESFVLVPQVLSGCVTVGKLHKAK